MKKIIIATAALLASSASLANTAGTHVIHGGLLNLNPANDQADVIANIPAAGGNVTISGATVDSTNTLGFGYDYYVTDNIAVGVQLGVPPKFDVISIDNTRGKIGEVEQTSPEIKAKYVFGPSSQKLRPYIGGGLAYVMFDGEVTHPQTIMELGPKVEVESKIAPVITAGANYQINEKFSVGASVSYVKLETDLTFPNNNVPGATEVFAEAKINPVVIYLNAGYSF